MNRLPVIAVLDDEPKLRKALRRLLVAHGFAVVTFEHGEDVIAALTAQPMDCLLLDLHMQHGYEPGDPAMEGADYILGRSGAWLGTHWFIRLPVPERRKEFIFSNLAEVMELMESLTSKVEVIKDKPANVSDDAPADEEMQKAIAEP